MLKTLNNFTSLINRYEMLVVSRFIPYPAMAMYPLIMVRNSRHLSDQVLLNHERIHHRQQVELFILPFYILYGFNYLVNLVRYKNHDQAYRKIIFELEAYSNEEDRLYLTKRKRWACFLIKS